MTRRESRVCALELLFDYEFNRESTPEERIELAVENRDIEISDFARRLFVTAVNHLDEIDAALSARTENWSFGRVSTLAKTIMRLCVCEVKYLGTPAEIAINEALEVIKMYDDDKAKQFINGVLGGVLGESAEESKDE